VGDDVVALDAGGGGRPVGETGDAADAEVVLRISVDMASAPIGGGEDRTARPSGVAIFAGR
jgi:hypothetical protein